MSLWLPFIFSGLVMGSVYGLSGVGLTLTYKTSGVFNFAHGALATISAFTFYTLYESHGMWWPLAAIISIGGVGIVLGLILERFGRALAHATLTTKVVATVGILLIVEGGIDAIYGQIVSRTVVQYLPTKTFVVDKAIVTYADVIVVAITLLTTLGLYLYFRMTRGGLAMRAVVDNPELLGIEGTSPIRVRRKAWIIGSTLAAASGVLLAPFLAQINAEVLILLVVSAFGAAAIGSFTSLPLSYVGGVVIGLAEALSEKFWTSGLLGAIPATLPFIVLFVVILVSPRGKLSDATTRVASGVRQWRAPWKMQAGTAVIALALLILVPSFVGYQLSSWTTFLTDVILLMSLGLLVRTSGQVSLCQVTFFAIGASSFSHFLVIYHVPWFLALLFSGLVAIPVGALLSIPASRLPALYLAIATLGFGILVEEMFYTQNYMFSLNDGGLTVPLPDVSWLSSTTGYYYLVLFFAVVVTAAIILLERSRLGRLLRALSTSPVGLSTGGTAINVTRVLVFSLSAFFAAIAGALAGGVQGVITAGNYDPLMSFTFFAVIVIVVGGTPWYAILGALGLVLIPSYWTNPNVTNYLTIVFGATALIYVLTPDDKRGVPLHLQQRLDKIFSRPRTASKTSDPAIRPLATVSSSERLAAARNASGLVVENLHIEFGGLTAVNGVSIKAPTGRVTGLIGPNGAGKTSFFNACSGLNRSIRGDIVLNDRRLNRRSSSGRARLGLGRSFQQMELFNTMTVRENVALGHEAGLAGRNPFTQIFSTPHQSTATRRVADESMSICGIAELADMPAGSLSTGHRRLVELARCLAGSYTFLLLDEPSSGLTPPETERFGEILQSVVSERGLGILLVEHDMSLVTSVCTDIYVMDFGQLIFNGTPPELLVSPIVQAAYLGSSSLLEGELVEEAQT